MKKGKVLVTLFFMILTLLCNLTAPLALPKKLTKIKEVPDLKQPESVIYDAKRNCLYVSNINGGATQKNGDGFIAKISLEGTIEKLDWITGLNAPKGLAIYKDTLYISDIDSLIEVDIPTEKIINFYPAPESQFLNDVTIDEKGNVYVSDMYSNIIYLLKKDSLDIWLKSKILDNPNGLCVKENNLIVASWGAMDEKFNVIGPGQLKKISLSDKIISGLGIPFGNLDGIKIDEQGNYYITDFVAGKILYVSSEGKETLLLKVKEGCADLEYIPNKKLILVPMMNDNVLIFYQVD